MKKFIFALNIVLFGTIITTFARQWEPIVVDGQKISKVGQNVQATIAIHSPSNNRCSYKIIAQPSITKGALNVDLPEIVFRTTKGRILDFRHNVMYPQDAIVADKGQIVNYTYMLPYKAWMNNAQLLVRVKITGCGKELIAPTIVAAQELQLPPQTAYIAKPIFAYAPIPDRENHIQSSVILFPLASAKLMEKLDNNSTELAQIETSLDNIDKNIAVKSIDITGSCSPEGSYSFNVQLAKNRAATVQKYILSKYPNVKSKINVNSIIENWNALAKALEGNTKPWAQEVVRIVSSNISDHEKNRRIESLDNGQTFQHLLKHIYPALRNTDYKLSYTASAPDSEDISNINNATREVEKGDIKAAVKHLKMVNTQSKYYFNTLGIIQMTEGDYPNAAQSFIKAVQMGAEQATENLKQLRMKIANIEIIQSER